MSPPKDLKRLGRILQNEVDNSLQLRKIPLPLSSLLL